MKLIIHFVRVIALVQGTVANLSKTIPVAREWPPAVIINIGQPKCLWYKGTP